MFGRWLGALAAAVGMAAAIMGLMTAGRRRHGTTG
jgi:hypothetical protein